MSISRFTLEGIVLATTLVGGLALRQQYGARSERAPYSLQVPGIRAVSQPETIATWPADACVPNDRPDVPVRALRYPGGIRLISGNAFGNFAMSGPDLDHLHRNCGTAPLPSPDNPDPHTFANREWITATYAAGDTVYAIVHNEFHDARAPQCRVGDSGPGNPCWYNSLTYAYSTDYGLTYRQAAEPYRAIAAAPSRWNASIGAPTAQRRPYGYFNPTNIVRGPDGYYYALFVAIPTPGGVRGTCAMRTRSLGDPHSWRAWDGESFSLAMRNPYEFAGRVPACAFVSRDSIRDFGTSITYNTTLRRYVMVGTWTHPGARTGACGFAAAYSPDLVHWSAPVVFMPMLPPSSTVVGCAAGESLEDGVYPSIIDPADTSRNFDRSGRDAYLYYVTGFHSGSRALRRIRLEFD